MGIGSALANIISGLRARSYDQYTIGDYFRSQGATIGQNTRLLIGDLGSEPYLITIEDEALVSVDVLLLTHDGATWVDRDLRPNVNKFGRVRICRRAFVGARSIVMPGVTIGQRAIVGAGSVVTRDVPPRTVVAGVPARVICTVDEYLDKAERGSVSLQSVDPKSMREALLRQL